MDRIKVINPHPGKLPEELIWAADVAVTALGIGATRREAAITRISFCQRAQAPGATGGAGTRAAGTAGCWQLQI